MLLPKTMGYSMDLPGIIMPADVLAQDLRAEALHSQEFFDRELFALNQQVTLIASP